MKTFSSTCFVGFLFVCFQIFFTLQAFCCSLPGAYIKMQTPFLQLNSSALLSAVTSLVCLVLAFLSGYLQNRFLAVGYWIKRYMHTYLILPDIVRSLPLGLCYFVFPQQFMTVCISSQACQLSVLSGLWVCADLMRGAVVSPCRSIVICSVLRTSFDIFETCQCPLQLCCIALLCFFLFFPSLLLLLLLFLLLFFLEVGSGQVGI